MISFSKLISLFSKKSVTILKASWCLILSFVSILSYGQVNLSYGLSAYLPLNGNANDSSGNNNGITVFGNPSYTTDQWGNFNQAIYLDGVDDYIQVSPSVLITPDTGFSVAFRYKPSGNNNRTAIITKSTWAASSNTTLNIQYFIGYGNPDDFGTSGLIFGTDHDGDCQNIKGLLDNYLTLSSAIDTVQWQCMAFTFRNGVKQIYVNGVSVGTEYVLGSVNNTAIDFCTAGELKIGAWWVGDPELFKGGIDEIRVYNRALSPAEVIAYCEEEQVRTNSVILPGNGSKLKVYPNPTYGKLTFEKEGQVPSEIFIYNAIGRLVAIESIIERKTIDISTLEPGIYFLKYIEDENMEVKKIVKL